MVAAPAKKPDAAPAPPSASADGARAPEPYESAFQQIVGRLPNETERARFHALQDTLQLRPNDALWALFVALEHYHTLYERFPAMIREAAGELLVTCKTKTDEVLNGAEKQLWNTSREQAHAAALAVGQASIEARAALEKAIQQAARRIALKAALVAGWPWLFGGALLLALALLLTAALAVGFGHQQGYHRGYVEGYRAAETAAKDRSAERPPPARGR